MISTCTHLMTYTVVANNAHLDLPPAIAGSDVQLSSLFRHISQGPLCGPLSVSAQSVERLIGVHLNAHSNTALVLCLCGTLAGFIINKSWQYGKHH